MGISSSVEDGERGGRRSPLSCDLGRLNPHKPDDYFGIHALCNPYFMVTDYSRLEKVLRNCYLAR